MYLATFYCLLFKGEDAKGDIDIGCAFLMP